MRYIAFVLLFFLLVPGCAHKHEEQKTHVSESIKKTVWGPKTEVFVEYKEPVVGEKVEFLFHITSLKDFKPVSEGTVNLEFIDKDGESIAAKIDAPVKPGIFKTDIKFKTKGTYMMKALISGQMITDEVAVSDIEVFEKGDEHDHHDEEEGDTITFTKEQQWKVDFSIDKPFRKTLSTFFIAMGELIPVSNAELTISAPLSGIVSSSKPLFTGKRVSKGEMLAVIEPPFQQQGGIGQLTHSYIEAKNRIVLAQNEYDRALRLYEAKAVPKKRLEEAEITLGTAKAALEPIEKAMAYIKTIASDNKIIITAPISGTVAEAMTSNGRFIQAGEPIVRIINTSILHLRADVPATDISNIKMQDIATFTVPGIDKEFRPTRLIAVSDMVDTKSRTVPVIFEVNNQRSILKAGMFANVSIKTGLAADALTLPESALFEDEGRHFVFVQLAGESFEKREVKTGIKDKGYVQIVEGIKEGERVVTRGGYYVKLASLSSKMPQGHGHDH